MYCLRCGLEVPRRLAISVPLKGEVYGRAIAGLQKTRGDIKLVVAHREATLFDRPWHVHGQVLPQDLKVVPPLFR